jgi:hypothetical protein
MTGRVLGRPARRRVAFSGGALVPLLHYLAALPVLPPPWASRQ